MDWRCRAGAEGAVEGLAGLANAAAGAVEGQGSTAAAFLAVCGVVTVHELGHFLAARLQGIHITKFSIGFGPTLFKYQGPEVEYAVRALPLGGFVAFPGEELPEPPARSGEERRARRARARAEPEAPRYPADDPDLLKNRPVADRLLVTSAGVVFNVALAFALMFGEASTYGILRTEYLPGVEVPLVLADSAGERGGLRQGDVILALDGQAIQGGRDHVDEVVSSIKDRAGAPMRFTVERGGRTLDLAIAPDRGANGKGRLGVQLNQRVEKEREPAANPAEAGRFAGAWVARTTKAIASGLAKVVSNPQENSENLSGPVKIVNIGAEYIRGDNPGAFLEFAAIISVNLAIVNSIPFPGLDGWYALLMGIESARGGKKIPPEVERSVSSLGLTAITLCVLYSIFSESLGGLFGGN